MTYSCQADQNSTTCYSQHNEGMHIYCVSAN